MNNKKENPIPFTITKGPSEQPYLELLRDGAQNCCLVPQEILDWSRLEPKDTSEAPTDNPRQRHCYTISALIKNMPQEKGKLRPLKVSKPTEKTKKLIFVLLINKTQKLR